MRCSYLERERRMLLGLSAIASTIRPKKSDCQQPRILSAERSPVRRHPGSALEDKCPGGIDGSRAGRRECAFRGQLEMLGVSE